MRLAHRERELLASPGATGNDKGWSYSEAAGKEKKSEYASSLWFYFGTERMSEKWAITFLNAAAVAKKMQIGVRDTHLLSLPSISTLAFSIFLSTLVLLPLSVQLEPMPSVG